MCFSLVYLAPGDPLQTILPSDASADTIAMVKAAYGFDKPIPVQFLKWLGHVLTGDFGESSPTRRPVILEVSGALLNTATLTLFAIPISFGIGYAMGAVAGCFPGRILDRVITGTAVFGVSLPNYWFGIVLVIIFSVQLMALPATGMGNSGSADFSVLRWNDARYLVLPVITLSMVPIGVIARTTAPRWPRCSESGLHHHLARQGPERVRHRPARAEERDAAGAGGDGVAIRLPHGRLDPARDRVHLAGAGSCSARRSSTATSRCCKERSCSCR